MSKKLSLSTLIKTFIMTMLITMSVGSAIAQSIYVNVGRPGYRTVWIPGHWYYGRWIPGHYVRYDGGYQRPYYRHHHRWHEGNYWYRY